MALVSSASQAYAGLVFALYSFIYPESAVQALSNDQLDSVIVTPLTSKSTSLGPKAKPADIEVKHLWTDGFVRLFLSHLSIHKVAVAELKSELEAFGISAFIAHEDIRPSLDWQNEIELALHSMHALAALLTQEFHGNDWTDQEIGVAWGRRVLVLPDRLGIDPYGFIGKVQGLSGSLSGAEQNRNRCWSKTGQVDWKRFTGNNGRGRKARRRPEERENEG